MNIEESLKIAKEIGTWLHGRANEIEVGNSRRVVMSVALLQQALDITDAIVILVGERLPGPAWALARPMHEGYVRGIWLLSYASAEKVEEFIEGKS